MEEQKEVCVTQITLEQHGRYMKHRNMIDDLHVAIISEKRKMDDILHEDIETSFLLKAEEKKLSVRDLVMMSSFAIGACLIISLIVILI